MAMPLLLLALILIGIVPLLSMFILPSLPSWLFEGPRTIRHLPRRHVCGDCGAPWTHDHECAPEPSVKDFRLPDGVRQLKTDARRSQSHRDDFGPVMVRLGKTDARRRRSSWVHFSNFKLCWDLLWWALASLIVLPGCAVGLRLARWMVILAAHLTPQPHRDRYEDEWLAEVEWAEVEWRESKKNLTLRLAIGILVTAYKTGLARRPPQLEYSDLEERLSPRAISLVVGVLSAIMTFAGIAVGLFPRDGVRPTLLQLALAGLASVIAGGMGFWQTTKDRHGQRVDTD